MTQQKTRQVVAKASDIAPGTSTVVTVKGRDIGIFNIGGEYFALANRCPHAGGPLCQGRIVALSAQSIAVRRRDDIAGDIVVHFPRAGFLVMPCTLPQDEKEE